MKKAPSSDIESDKKENAPKINLEAFVATHPPRLPDELKVPEIAAGNLAFVAFVANLGSFLFGYDFGAVCWFLSAVDNSTDDDSELYFKLIANDDSLIGLIASGAAIGALITYMFLLFLGNSIPKRDEIMLAAFLLFVGALLESSSGDMSWSTWHGLTMLLAGRFIYGAGIATSFHSVPIYVSEIGPAELRGMIGSSTESMVSTGVVVSYIIGYCYQSNMGWIVTFRCAYIIALIMGLLALFLPHTPSFMVRNNYPREEILEGIRFIRPTAGDSEIHVLQDGFVEELKERKRWEVKWQKQLVKEDICGSFLASFPSEVKVLFNDLALRRCLFLALTLVMLQMFTGQSAILYYASDIFDTICPIDTNDCILGLGISKLVSAYSMLFIGDSFGRREFLLGGLSIMICGMIALCVGIRYDNTIVAVTGIYISVMGYELSLGTMLWIMLSEIFPRFVRSAANSIAVSSLFAWSVVVTFSLPYLEDAIGLLYVFVIFTCSSTLSIFLVFLFVPDTRGVDIEVAYKLVKTQCNDSLSPIGLGVDEDDEDETEMLDDVSDSSSESAQFLKHPTHRNLDTEPVML